MNITAEFYGDVTKLSWTPHAYGVIVQDFELWYRPVGATDYSWKSVTFKQFGNETANITGLFGKEDYVIRIRGQNKEGVGPFSNAFIMLKNGTGFQATKDEVAGERKILFVTCSNLV